jgi:hypothetical protein
VAVLLQSRSVAVCSVSPEWPGMKRLILSARMTIMISENILAVTMHDGWPSPLLDGLARSKD